jgi:hypothetical protein
MADRLDRDRVAKVAVETGGELAPVDEQPHAAVVTQNCERQRQWRVRHVATADIEQPRDRLRHRQHRGRDSLLGEAAREAGALVGRALAGEAVGMRHDRGERRSRSPRPDPVHRIAVLVIVHRAQAGPGAFGSNPQPLDLLRRVQPGVVAENGSFAERGAEPLRRRFLGDVPDLEQCRIDLRGGLQCVAAIDEQRGAILEHDRHAGRAGEPGQPCEALRAGRHVLALVLVRTRHDEPVETTRFQLLA